MRRRLIYILITFVTLGSKAQVLWQASSGFNYIYEPVNDLKLPGINVGIGGINKSGFIFQFNAGRWYQDRRYKKTKYSNDYLSYGWIPFYSFLYGYTTDFTKKFSMGILGGFGGNEIGGISFFNISSLVRYRINKRIYLYNLLYLKSQSIPVFNFETGLSYVFSKKDKVNNFTFNDSIKKKIFWYFGYGVSVSLAEFYMPFYDNYMRVEHSEKRSYSFYTMDLSGAVVLRPLIVKYMARIYLASGNENLYIGGETRVFNSVIIGFTNIENKRKFYYTIGNGWFFTNDLYYEINLGKSRYMANKNEFIAVGEFFERILLTPYLELGLQKNKISLGVYFQRVGSRYNRLLFDGGGSKPFYTVQTWSGIILNYKI